MPSNPVSTQVIVALALAILMAWAGHTSALFMGSSQAATSGNADAHSHAHNDGAFACATCADHVHSPLAADHVHETPHLTRLLSISTPLQRAQPLDAPRHCIPASPIYLIERPPRPILVV